MGCGIVKCGPNEAMIISGCGHSRPKIVPGGRSCVWPCFQLVQKIPLNTMTLLIESVNVYTQHGVPLTITGVAQVKIESQNREMLMKACELFLGMPTMSVIAKVALESLEGHQRAIMGTMTVEEIYQDRKKFSRNVYEVASADLTNMGFTIISYTIKDVRDSNGYLEALGKSRTGKVKRDARIGEAEAKRDSQIKQSLAKEELMSAKYLNDTEVARAKKDFELKKAAFDLEVETQRAEADMAYEIQRATTNQRIREENIKVKVVEREQEIAVQDQEILRRKKELDATVRHPAEAEKFRLETIAEADRKRVILEAEATAEGIKIKGEAEAFALEAKGMAEAGELSQKAAAFKLYKDAAVVQMLLDVLPKVAAEVARPLSQTEKIRMISTGGEIGPARLTTEILETVLRMPQLISTVTGVDITKSN